MFRKPSVPKPGVGMVAGAMRSPARKFILYLLLIALASSLLSLRFLWEYTEALTVFIGFQVVLASIGIFHAWYIRYRLFWDDEWVLLKQIGFGFLAALSGALLFVVVGKLLINLGTQAGDERISLDELLMFAPAWLSLPIPYLVAMTFEKAIRIPKKEYKLWFYSDDQKLPDFDLIDFSNSLILSFEFPKRFNDTSVSNFKFKAPVSMNFCDLFYGYLNEYNDRHRDQPIEYQDENGKPYGWLFYVYTGSRWKKKIIDPHLSVTQNGIKERDVILPKRFVVAE